MEIFREKEGRSLQQIVTDYNLKEPLTLVDEEGKEYTFEKVWSKPYQGVIFCVLRLRSEEERLNYLFRLINYRGETVLYYERNEKNCRIITNDFYKNNEELRGERFNNLTYEEKLNNRPVAIAAADSQSNSIQQTATYGNNKETADIEQNKSKQKSVKNSYKSFLILEIILLLLSVGILIAGIFEYQFFDEAEVLEFASLFASLFDINCKVLIICQFILSSLMLIVAVILCIISIKRIVADGKERKEKEKALFADKIKNLPVYGTTVIEGGQQQEEVKFKKPTMIILIVMYSLLLLAGILLAAVPQLSTVLNKMGICEEFSARAYAVTIGLMWIALTPSIGYYFATIPHIEISKKNKIMIAAVTTALLVIMTIVFFIIVYTFEVDGFAVKYYFEAESESDIWFIPLSMVFAVLGIMICYALTLFKIKPDNINDIYTEQKSDSIVHVIQHILMLIIGLVFKLMKVILRLKEKHVNIFIVLATLLLTWLVFFAAFIFAIICIAVLVLVIALYFAKFVKFASEGMSSSTQLVIYDGGEKITLEYQLGAIGDDRYETVYKDNYGRNWYSVDGGKTVYRKS